MISYRRGALFMLAAVGTFSFMDMGMKLLSPHYPAMQVAALRGLALYLGFGFANRVMDLLITLAQH